MEYSIDQFSKITGITKLVLRTWENRYNFLQADRTSTNIRSYSDDLLISALNTKFLIDSGYKISFIVKQKECEINKLIDQMNERSKSNSSSYTYYINKFIQSGIKFDAQLFNRIYKKCLLDFNHIELYKNIILPTLHRIGMFWLTNRINPAQEHFLSEMFKQKIYRSIDEINVKKNKSKTWLLFLPPNEHHELGLLFTRLLLLSNGYNVVYLGANVPLLALREVSKNHIIDCTLFFSISNLSKLKLNETLSFLDSQFNSSTNYLVSRDSLSELKDKPTIKCINSLNQFVDIL